NEIDPDESGRFLKVYGVADDELLEPMFVTRTGHELPEYDLHDVDETLVVRVTESEFGA
ncbi:MAG: tRNA U34 5-methylaminomethyl-2-thiouridine-forming methyltransferase MnmC, partial [Natronomonas sp.]